MLAALSDVLFVAPLIETLRMHSSDEGQREANTYMLVGRQIRTNKLKKTTFFEGSHLRTKLGRLCRNSLIVE